MTESVESQPGLAYTFSLALALSIGAIPNHCYANAWETFQVLADRPDSSLIEGWMVLEQASEITLIEHCWCQCGQATVDPSIVLLLRRSQCQQAHYIPGIQRTQAELQRLACRDLPYVRSCGQFGPDGMGHPEYCSAYQSAQQVATRLGEASSKPLVIQPATFPKANGGPFALTIQVTSSHTLWQPARE